MGVRTAPRATTLDRARAMPVVRSKNAKRDAARNLRGKIVYHRTAPRHYHPRERARPTSTLFPFEIT